MRIFAFVDSHGSKEINVRLLEVINKDSADVIVCAGDYTDFARFGASLYEVLQQTMRPVLYVYGNHEHDVKGCHINCGRDLDSEIVVIDKVAFCGFSGHDIFDKSRLWRMDEVFNGFKERFSHMEPEKIVLVTHEPPSNWQWPGNEEKKAGSPRIAQFIEEVGASLVICGHLHVNKPAVTCLDGDLRIINPSATGSFIDV